MISIKNFLTSRADFNMAYYDLFITKWNTLSGSTTSKLAQVNSATVSGPSTPMIIPTYKIYNVIDTTEFTALSAANQQLVRDILGMGTVDGSAGTSIRNRMLAIFGAGTATRTALTALASVYDSPSVPWWQANGYLRPFDMGDVTAAGLS